MTEQIAEQQRVALRDLKLKNPTELLEVAEKLEIENASSLRTQEQGQIILTFGWFHLKLLMVVGISAMHGVFVGMNKKIGTEKAPKPKTLRMINEVPFVLMIVAVIAVVVQPF